MAALNHSDDSQLICPLFSIESIFINSFREYFDILKEINRIVCKHREEVEHLQAFINFCVFLDIRNQCIALHRMCTLTAAIEIFSLTRRISSTRWGEKNTLPIFKLIIEARDKHIVFHINLRQWLILWTIFFNTFTWMQISRMYLYLNGVMYFLHRFRAYVISFS